MKKGKGAIGNVAMFAFVLAVSGCSTYVTPRYSISADTNVALKALNVSSIAVASFSGPTAFDPNCRAAGPLAPPDGISHTEYIKKALEDELKVAGLHATAAPRVILTGVVNKLEFSSSRALLGGSWTIDLTLSSSNGKKMSMAEYYEFQSGYAAETACKQTAEAYMPAVQDLIGKLVKSPEFRGLVQ